MLYRFLATVLIIEVVHSEYGYVTTFSAAFSPQNGNFGQSITLAVNGDIVIVVSASISGADIFSSSNNGNSWEYIQQVPLSFTGSPFQIASSTNGDELILFDSEARFYVNFEGQYVLTGQSFVFTDDNCQGKISINSIALSGNGRLAFFGGQCPGYNVEYVSFIFVYDLIKEGPINEIFVEDPSSPQLPPAVTAIATNNDGSTFVINGANNDVIVYTGKHPSTATNFITGCSGDSLSLSSDGSILAVGSCGIRVCIYSMSNLSSPSQILTSPDMTNVNFGCNVDLSDDGSRLIVGSSVRKSNGLAYAYQNINGVFSLETKLSPPYNINPSFGGGGIAVVNKNQNEGIVLVGGPTAGILQSGQIAVFRSVIASISPTTSRTVSATTSSTASSTGTTTSTSSTSVICTASTTSTYSSTSISSFTSSPSSSIIPISPNILQANSYNFEATFGIALSGGIVGSLIGFFIFRWSRKYFGQSKESLQISLNSENPAGSSPLFST